MLTDEAWGVEEKGSGQPLDKLSHTKDGQRCNTPHLQLSQWKLKLCVGKGVSRKSIAQRDSGRSYPSMVPDLQVAPAVAMSCMRLKDVPCGRLGGFSQPKGSKQQKMSGELLQ